MTTATTTIRYFDILLPAAIAFVLAVILTPAVRGLARHYGAVAKPKSDRWHKKPTAMFGGVAIFIAVVGVVIFQFDHPAFSRTILPASTLLFILGLVDDILHLKPYQKLIGQIMGAAIIIYAGLVLPWTSSPLINIAVTIFWLIGITNAVNMLDNMDGLAAGVAAIASVFMAMNFASQGQMVEATVVAVFGAALIGFLLYNSNPASIFMGDCGSMFIGFFLASTALVTATSGRTRSFLPVIAVPVLTLLIPIFDTTFVTLLRKLAGRSASQGGRDHTSHRLVALGLSERRAVWLLYGLAGLSGILALQVKNWQIHESVVAILGFTIILTLTGVYLGGVKVYDPGADVKEHALVSFLVDISYKRRVFEALLDVSLIIVCYYAAYTLRFGRLTAGDPNLDLFIRTVPIVVFVKMGIFLAVGIYRGLWRYTSLHDLVLMGKGVLLASLGSVIAILYAFRFDGFSRAVFMIDGLLLLVGITLSRVAFRLIRRMIPTPHMKEGRRVLIYGAGDAGELLLRELFNNHDLQYAPVGFLDDDPKKIGKLIHGLRVYSGDSVAATAEELRAQEVVISTWKIDRARLANVISTCEEVELPLKQMRIQLIPLTDASQLPHEEPEPVVVVDKTAASPRAARLSIRTHGSTHVHDGVIVRAEN